MTDWHLPRALWLSWLALLMLLGLTVLLAYQPLGALNTAAALAIAAIKASLVAAIFMELRRGQALAVVLAAAGLFWLSIMLWLTMADYLTRPASA